MPSRDWLAGTLELYAVSEWTAGSIDRSITGNTHAAVAASMPVRNAHEPRNAWPSRFRRSPTATTIKPATARASDSHASGRPAAPASIGALTYPVSTVASGQSTATAAYRQHRDPAAALLHRAVGLPREERAPWPASATSAKTPDEHGVPVEDPDRRLRA